LTTSFAAPTRVVQEARDPPGQLGVLIQDLADLQANGSGGVLIVRALGCVLGGLVRGRPLRDLGLQAVPQSARQSLYIVGRLFPGALNESLSAPHEPSEERANNHPHCFRNDVRVRSLCPFVGTSRLWGVSPGESRAGQASEPTVTPREGKPFWTEARSASRARRGVSSLARPPLRLSARGVP
jgi:hypothetical protein